MPATPCYYFVGSLILVKSVSKCSGDVSNQMFFSKPFHDLSGTLTDTSRIKVEQFASDTNKLFLIYGNLSQVVPLKLF